MDCTRPGVSSTWIIAKSKKTPRNWSDVIGLGWDTVCEDMES